MNVIEIEEGVYVEFDSSLTIEGDEISNLDLNHLTVKEILQLINTNMNLEILKYNDTKLEENDKVGTGSKLIIKNQNDQVVYQYKFIVYGDVNGDGNINSLDVLVLQKHILETKLLTQEFLKAGNISRNGSLPSSLDVLKIQKHILEIKQIEQGENKNVLNNKSEQEDIIDENIKEEVEDENIIDENLEQEIEDENIINEENNNIVEEPKDNNIDNKTEDLGNEITDIENNQIDENLKNEIRQEDNLIENTNREEE